MINPAPIQQPLNGGGVISTIWARWFDSLRREIYIVPSYTVANLPTNANAGSLAFVTNEIGGSVLAFNDGTNWRRSTDRAICS